MRRRFPLLVVATGLAILAAAPPALAAHSGRLTFTSEIGALKPPHKVVRTPGVGTVTMRYRRLSAKYIFVETVAIHGNRLECWEFPEGNPPERYFTARYSRTVRFDERVQVAFPPGARWEEQEVRLDKGNWFEYPHSDWEWKWRMTVEIGRINPGHHIYVQPILTMKPNQFAECGVGDVSLKPLL
jgi:hypothetical protein